MEPFTDGTTGALGGPQPSGISLPSREDATTAPVWGRHAQPRWRGRGEPCGPAAMAALQLMC
jgi:hypothetical protein